jgi:hypothetical protein
MFMYVVFFCVLLCVQARQALLCSDLKRSGEIVFPESLRCVGPVTASSKCAYSSMGLHECLAKAWAGVLAIGGGSQGSDGRGEEEEEECSTVLLQGVEVSD